MLWLAGIVSASAADLNQIRYADHGNFFRIVLDFSSMPQYRLIALDKEPTVQLDLKSTRLRCPGEIQIGHPSSPVRAVTAITGNGEVQSVRFHLKDGNVRSKYFTLQDPERLVVDFYRVTPERPMDLSQPNVKVVVIDPGHGGWDTGAQGYGFDEKEIVLDVAKRLHRYFQASDSFQSYLTRDRDILPFLDPGDNPDPQDQQQRLALRRKSLEGRVEYANQPFQVGGEDYLADLFVSIHVNTFPRNRTVNGFEIWIPGEKIAQDEMSGSCSRWRTRRRRQGAGPDLNGSNREAAKVILSMMGEQMGMLNPIAAHHIEQRMRGIDSGLKSRGIKEGPFQVLRQLRMPALLVEIGFISNRGEVERYLSQDWFRQHVAYALYMGINDYFEETEGFQPDPVQKPPKPMSPRYVVYQVRQGDSLYKLEQNYGVSYKTIKKVNDLKSDTLTPGQRLRIPVVQ
jgi:N-acetylmuramoyl-L-alanine amidase